MKKNYPLLFTCTTIILGFVSSCSWLEKDVQIPSYVHIPEYKFESLPSEGTASHNITDAWLYVNGQKIGAFELPATIPVLASGNCEIDIFPGIKLNGTAATRAVYTFYSRFSANVVLYPDSTVTITPSATYVSGLTFDFIEDFESVGVIFEKTFRSDTTLHKINDPDHVFEGLYAGHIALKSDRPFCEVKSIDNYALPQGGGYSFIELNCKSTIPFYVGVNANEFGYSTQHPIVVITPSDQWKKIYVNLTPTVSRLQSAINFSIFIAAQLEENSAGGKIWIDNIKLLHY